MEQRKKYCCLILSDSDLNTAPPINSDGGIAFLNTTDLEEAITVVCNRYIDCIILQVNQQTNSVCRFYTELTGQFPAIPILIILNNRRIELACRLVRLGAEHVIAATETDKIETLLRQTISKRHLRGGGRYILS